MLLENLVISAVMVVLCVTVHAGGLSGMISMAQNAQRDLDTPAAPPDAPVEG